MNVTKNPLKRPHRTPTPRAPTTPSPTLPVACHSATKPTMPRDIVAGNERSMSPATITIVSDIAMIAKYGVVWANDR